MGRCSSHGQDSAFFLFAFNEVPAGVLNSIPALQNIELIPQFGAIRYPDENKRYLLFQIIHKAVKQDVKDIKCSTLYIST